jgi:hypothetical protein
LGAHEPPLGFAGGSELILTIFHAAAPIEGSPAQPDAITDYKVFPDMDHTLGLGTQGVVVLFLLPRLAHGTKYVKWIFLVRKTTPAW